MMSPPKPVPQGRHALRSVVPGKARPDPGEVGKVVRDGGRAGAYPAVAVRLPHFFLARPPPHQHSQQSHIVGARSSQEGRCLRDALWRARGAWRAQLLLATRRIEGVVGGQTAGVRQAREVLVVLVVLLLHLLGVLPGLRVPGWGRWRRGHAARPAALESGSGQQHHAGGRGARSVAEGTPWRAGPDALGARNPSCARS